VIAVIDTSVLITFFRAGHIELLLQLYNEVYIPRHVEVEFLDHEPDAAFSFLTPLYEENTWLIACQTYDRELFDQIVVEPKMHKGESEVIAQMRKVQTDLKLEPGAIECLLDDRKARNIAKNMDIPVRGSLILLARLHFLGYLDYHSTVEPIAKERRFATEIIDEAFRIAEEEALGGQK
jgi:predicted nucleic acid-binding protein